MLARSLTLCGAVCSIVLAPSPATSQAPPSSGGTPADIAAIAKAGAEFSRMYMAGDAAGMANLYTESGAIFPGGRPIIRGRDAIKAYWTLAPGVKMVDHKTIADSIVVTGNKAIDYGTFRSQSARDGQTNPVGYGKYVIVWEKQRDGRWLMYLDIWNGSPAPQP